MKVRITAPEGYKLRDSLTNRDYSEVVVEEKARDRFTLVPASQEPMTIEERR